jgi:Tfp pilus assembly protein PilO
MRSSLSLAVIAVSILTYFFLISPKIGEVKSLIAEKAQYADVLNKVEEINQKRDALLTDYNNIPQEDLDKLQKVIPDTFDAADFANDINNLATQFGLAIKTYAEESGQSNGTVDVQDAVPYKTHAVAFTVAGQYASFMKFLDAAETNLNLTDIDSLSIKSSTDAKSSQETLEITVKLSTYSLK